LHPGELRKKILDVGFVDSLRKHLGGEDRGMQRSAIQALFALTKYGVVKCFAVVVVVLQPLHSR
jgi:hypothetical protein